MKYLSRKHAAEALDVSVPTVDRWIKAGKLPCSKVEGHVLISESGVRRMLAMADDARRERAAREWRDTCEWVTLNPGPWEAACSDVRARVARGERVSMREVMEGLRRKDWTDSGGRPSRINNAWSPYIARLMVTENPELRDSIEMRDAAADLVAWEVA